jgi:hypothetical protein
MEHIIAYLKQNYLKLILGTLIIVLSFKGLTSLWVDFKESIFQSELKQKGVSLEVEERLVVKAAEETEEAIEEAISTSPIENTRTETLCQWTDSLSSPWPFGVLEETSNSELTITPGALTMFGFDVSPSRRNASLVAGQMMPDGKIAIGILETFESQDAVDDLRIAASIKGWADIYRPRMVLFDKYTTASIAERLSNAGVVTNDCSGQQFYQACGDLLDGLVNHRVVHNGQDELIQQFNNCAAKVNDSSWRIVKRKSAGDVSAPISIAMVVSQLMKPQSTPQIYI